MLGISEPSNSIPAGEVWEIIDSKLPTGRGMYSSLEGMIRKESFFNLMNFESCQPVGQGFKKTCITEVHMESCSTSEPLLLPPRSAPKASLPSSLDFKWCFSDGVYRGVATPFRSLEGLIFGLLTLNPLFEKKPVGTLRATWEALPTRPCSYPAKRCRSTNKNWAVDKEILELENICLGVLGIASFDSFLCVCFFFLLMGFLGFWSVWPSVISHRQGFTIHTHNSFNNRVNFRGT